MNPDTATAPKVLLAPSLKSDGWISMDLYRENILAAFSRFCPDLSVGTLSPDEAGQLGNPGRQVARYVSYPRLLRRAMGGSQGAALVHILDHSYGHLSRYCSPSIVTCHDLAPFRTGELSGVQMRLWAWRVRGMKAANRIIAISRNTARDVAELLEVPTEKIVVNPSGVEDVFRRLSGSAENPVKAKLAAAAGSQFRILHVGSNIYRKNIPVLLRALAILLEQGWDVTLVKVSNDLVSDGYGPLMEELSLTDRVVALGYLDETALVQAYNACDVLAFPSLYEGFGRPLLEAQACGLPVVLARASCFEELAGDSALFHDPEDPKDLADKIAQVLKQERLKEDLSRRGLRNAEKFTWKRHVECLRNVYLDVLGESSGRAHDVSVGGNP